MKLSGLHILLTYQCTFECDHCFVWGSPWQKGTLTLKQIGIILKQAKEAGVDWIYYEGGEPFLYYASLVRAVEMACDMEFQVGVVSNGYWAHTTEDARLWLNPLAGKLADLSISSDLYHYSEEMNAQAGNAVAAAEELGIPVGTISVAQPEEENTSLMFRGRASQKLVSRADMQPWDRLMSCPHEDLRDPGRVHLDPLGNLHICQGVAIGNLFEKSLGVICAEYDPDAHPVCGPLLAGGPAALVEEYNLPHESNYADACHLCYEARSLLRARFPAILTPDQMYGVF